MGHRRGAFAFDVPAGDGEVGDETKDDGGPPRLNGPEPQSSPPRAGRQQSSRPGKPQWPRSDVGETAPRTAFSPSRRWARPGIAMIAANKTAEGRYPRFSVIAVRSPAAVPRAKVAKTAAQ